MCHCACGFFTRGSCDFSCQNPFLSVFIWSRWIGLMENLQTIIYDNIIYVYTENNWIWYWRKTRSSPQQPSKGQEIEPAMVEQPPCHVAQHGGQRNLGKGVIFCHVQPPAVTKDTKARKQWGSTLALQRKGLPAAAVQSSRPQPDVQLYAQQFQGFVPQGRCLIMSSQLPFNQPGPSASRWPRLNHNEEELLLADHHLTRYSWK